MKTLAVTAALLLVTVASLATPAAGKGGTGQVFVYAAGSCTGGAWTLDARATSNSSQADLHVDLRDDGNRLLAANVQLRYGVPFLFSVTPSAGARKDTLEVYVTGGVQELGRFQAVTVCA